MDRLAHLTTEQYVMGGFVGLVTLFSLTQIFRAVSSGRITTPTSSFRTKDRRQQPFGFWASLTYYVVWVVGAGYSIAMWLLHR